MNRLQTVIHNDVFLIGLITTHRCRHVIGQFNVNKAQRKSDKFLCQGDHHHHHHKHF